VIAWERLIYTYTYIHTPKMAVEGRRRRVDRVLKMLKSAEPPMGEVRFVAMASYNIGVSQKTIREYLQVLEGMGVFDIEEGLIKCRE